MNIKSILISSALVVSTGFGMASANIAPMPAPEPIPTTNTPTQLAGLIGDPAQPSDLLCNPDDGSDCMDLADPANSDTFVFVLNANAAPPRTTRWQYYRCVLAANAVRTACDLAFATVIGGATYVTGGAAGVATTVAGVGVFQSLKACYALYTAQYNSCRIDRGLPTVANPL